MCNAFWHFCRDTTGTREKMSWKFSEKIKEMSYYWTPIHVQMQSIFLLVLKSQVFYFDFSPKRTVDHCENDSKSYGRKIYILSEKRRCHGNFLKKKCHITGLPYMCQVQSIFLLVLKFQVFLFWFFPKTDSRSLWEWLKILWEKNLHSFWKRRCHGNFLKKKCHITGLPCAGAKYFFYLY